MEAAAGKKQKNSTSRYRHLLECCELLGIGNITPFLDRMLVLDYIIANEDRHFNNFGALRNAETLEWLGMAPIYDSGSSSAMIRCPVRCARKGMWSASPSKTTTPSS